MEKIEIRNVCKRYGEKTVLKDFSLSLDVGQTHVIMGASGCGKTTLLRLIAGLETADQGEITGIDRHNLAMVFQEDRLIAHLTALKNVALAASGPDARARAREILVNMNLADSLDKPARTLSGGMARRVAIARALASDADTVIMDEPFKGLDEDTHRRVLEEVRKYTRAKTLIVVTHDAEEARALGGRVNRMTAVEEAEENGD